MIPFACFKNIHCRTQYNCNYKCCR